VRFERFPHTLRGLRSLAFIAGANDDVHTRPRPPQGQTESQVAGSSDNGNFLFAHISSAK
jgi:hypothetical protein